MTNAIESVRAAKTQQTIANNVRKIELYLVAIAIQVTLMIRKHVDTVMIDAMNAKILLLIANHAVKEEKIHRNANVNLATLKMM